jgi:hypothetical protein
VNIHPHIHEKKYKGVFSQPLKSYVHWIKRRYGKVKDLKAMYHSFVCLFVIYDTTDLV